MPSVQSSLAADPGALQQLLDEASESPQIRPTPVRRTELDHLLRAELRRLTPRVQAQADRINPGTRAWYSRDKALGEARGLLSAGLSPSALAASLHLAALARTVRTLDEFAGGAA
jgi:hypothetical protein